MAPRVQALFDASYLSIVRREMPLYPLPELSFEVNEDEKQSVLSTLPVRRTEAMVVVEPKATAFIHPVNVSERGECSPCRVPATRVYYQPVSVSA